MGVVVDMVEGLSALGGWVHVHRHLGHMGDMMQHLMTDLLGHLVPVRDCCGRIYGDVDLEGEAMTDPACAHFGDVVDP